MVITKLEDVTKQGFCKILRGKLRLRGSHLLVLIQFQFHTWGGGWCLFEAERLLTFSAFRMGAHTRCALIRINTVIKKMYCVNLP